MKALDKKLNQKAKQLARKECANLIDGDCIDYDKPCFLISPKYDSIHDGAIDCDIFLLNVLPLQPDLQKAIWAEIIKDDDSSPQEMKECFMCHKLFIPMSNRQKYCADCQLYARRARGRDKQQRYSQKQKSKTKNDPLER